jgi:hypothetical protein
MDFLFGGGVGQSSSGLATASSSYQNDASPLSRIPTTAPSTHSAAAAAATATTGGGHLAAVGQPVSHHHSPPGHTAGGGHHGSAGGSGAAAAAATVVTSAHFNGHDNGPILYDNLNRTSAIDDIRSVVIYIFIITIFLSFFLILPGIRSGKFPTFLCIITSLLVTSIIVISLNGTTWHVGEAPISAPYKAFSRDRIQGDLGVRIGLQSVNISLKAHKYYILHAVDGPTVMENTHKYSLLHQPLMVIMAPVPAAPPGSSATPANPQQQLPQPPQHHQQPAHDQLINGQSSWPHADGQSAPSSISASASTFIHRDQADSHHLKSTSANERGGGNADAGLAEELLTGRTSDGGISVDTELEADEPFASTDTSSSQDENNGDPEIRPQTSANRRVARAHQSSPATNNQTNVRNKRQQMFVNLADQASSSPKRPQYTIKRVYVDINYNERFYWIEPMQMRREYQQALERGLPYPILTVVEYLSQDDGGFSWSRQYRAAGYYTSMLLWLSASVCVLMFCLHCAAPKYGIYAMQSLGVLLLLTNLNYATLVPRGDQKLVIPFEGQSLTFRFGWNFWLVLIGGKC